MLVYAHRSFPLDPDRRLDACLRAIAGLPAIPDYDHVVDLFVDFAEVESAVGDALQPVADDDHPDLEGWRRALTDTAQAVVQVGDGDGNAARASLAAFARHAETLRGRGPRVPVRGKAAEGFAQFALLPEQYIDAADRFLPRHGTSTVVCIGIRSIGSALAALVGARLSARGRRVLVRTVRPRGHPFDRQIQAGGRLRNLLGGLAAHHFVVVDEGPGLSGSSFGGTVTFLRSLGVPHERITLMPAWQPQVSALRSLAARHAFDACEVIVGRVDHARAAAPAAGGATLVDVSAGKWRGMIFGPSRHRWPPSQPQHERVKFVAGDGPGRLVRFAGLGRHGRSRWRRAAHLHEAGFGPEPLALARGFLALEWIPGTALRARPVPGPGHLSRIADYIACVARLPDEGADADHAGDVEVLGTALQVNAGAVLGQDGAEALRALAPDRDAVGRPLAVDGRMLPMEWIDAGSRLMKVDALDHHDNDFLPGHVDLAWDVAGVCVEFSLGGPAQTWLTDALIQRLGDDGLRRRLPFYRACYLAWRIAYTELAAASVAGTPDADGFSRLARRYRRSLAALAARAPRPAAR